MASLKDLRNRIAATKATQKITRAMQMVAASKLRRAQAAAEAARPYATQMDKVLGNIAAAVGGLDTAPRLLRGSGGDNVRLLLVCTAEREIFLSDSVPYPDAVSPAFNSLHGRLNFFQRNMTGRGCYSDSVSFF